MYRYQTVLFDLDGTLTDSKEGIVNSARFALEQLNAPPLPESVLQRFVGPPLADSFMRFCGFDEEKARTAVRIFRDRYVPVGQYENRAAEGMVELCASLHAHGLTLALASSKPESTCRSICERFGFTPYLREIVGSPPDNVDWEKKEVIREAMRRLGLTDADREHTIMVGDRSYDVEGARACGLACAGTDFFHYGEPDELENAGAVIVVHTAAELEEFLLRKM